MAEIESKGGLYSCTYFYLGDCKYLGIGHPSGCLPKSRLCNQGTGVSPEEIECDVARKVRKYANGNGQWITELV